MTGLYLAGGAAHPGPGMPMVLMSGWIAADTLDQDQVAPKAPVRDGTRASRLVARVRGMTAPRPVAAASRRRAVPRRWPWLVRGFRKYAARYVRKHFHAVRLSKSGAAFPPADEPLLVVLNHPSWWDPLIGIVLSREFADRDQFAAIDAVAVRAVPLLRAARVLRRGHEVAPRGGRVPPHRRPRSSRNRTACSG